MIKLLAEKMADGSPVYELVPCDWVDERTRKVRLTRSPALCRAASGDILKVNPDQSFEIVERGGNVSVQIMAAPNGHDIAEKFDRRVRALGGVVDAVGPIVVLTIPVTAGFARIEAMMTGTSDWFYGNVYDPADDVTPLNWWLPPT